MTSVKIGQRVVVTADADYPYPVYDVNLEDDIPHLRVDNLPQSSVGYITYARDCLYWVSETNDDPIRSDSVSRGRWLTRDQFTPIPEGASEEQIEALVHMLGQKEQ